MREIVDLRTIRSWQATIFSMALVMKEMLAIGRTVCWVTWVKPLTFDYIIIYQDGSFLGRCKTSSRKDRLQIVISKAQLSRGDGGHNRQAAGRRRKCKAGRKPAVSSQVFWTLAVNEVKGASAV